MVNIRLDKETDELLNRAAKTTHLPKGRIINASIKEYCSRIVARRQLTPYELAKDLIGKEGSGRGDLSMKGEEILH